MILRQKTRTNEEVNTQKIAGLLKMSFSDYLAARILINRNKLLQGCILANTAIEKHFKALMEAQSTKSFGNHDLIKQLPFVKNQYPEIYKKLNIEFLTQLSEIYKSRYIDSLPIGYNFAIIQRKYIAELDFTYSILEPTLKLQNSNNKNQLTSEYQTSLKNKDIDLWSYNYLLNKMDKTTFVEQPCFINEFRVLPNGVFLDISYSSNSVENDNKFNYNALTPTEDPSSFTFTHLNLNTF
jgi:HEPN domain